MRPIRWLVPNTVWLVTNRCELEQLLLLPVAGINDLIGAWLARALEKYGDGIDLYGFVFLGNHFHLLLRDTKGQLSKFMWYFQTNLAKAINRALGRKTGRVFARRFDAEMVSDEESFLGSYAYVLGNAVKAGLVEHASEWPGLSSLGATLADETMRFVQLDRTAYHNATRRGQQVEPSRFMKEYEIRLAPPPMWVDKSKVERAKLVTDLVAGFEARQVAARRAEGRGFLGVAGVLSQRPTDRALEPEFAVREYVLCRDHERRNELKLAWREVTGMYRERHGELRVAAQHGRRFHNEWPPWTCPPSCMEPIGYAAAA
jgi:REP element-mobilizing transposase RayT